MITKESPEITATVEICRAALVRTAIRFNITRDMEDASWMLGLALYKSYLRHYVYALTSIERHGPEAVARAHRYLEKVGYPKENLRITRHAASDKRRTPPEVRAWWGVCDEAVGETLMGLSDNSRKALTLNLSWGLHNAVYHLNKDYRENVDEMRRIRRTDRFSAASWVIALLPAVAAGLAA